MSANKNIRFMGWSYRVLESVLKHGEPLVGKARSTAQDLLGA